MELHKVAIVVGLMGWCIMFSNGFKILELRSGILFTKQGPVFITGNKWTIALDCSLWALRNELRRLEGEFDILQERMGNSTMFQEVAGEFSTLQYSYRQLKDRLHYMQDMLPQRRVKRGWLDAGGKLLKTVFGTADSDDIMQLNTTMQDIGNTVDITKATVAWHTTQIGRLEQEVLNNTKAIRHITQELSKYLLATTNTLNADLKMVQTHLNTIDSELTLGRALRLLTDKIINARLITEELQEALHHAMQGQLSTALLPPDTFITILIKLQKQLPQNLQLIFAPDKFHIARYYHLATVQVSTNNAILRVQISFPVADKSSIFDGYAIHPFPIRWHALNKLVQIKTHQMLIISHTTNASAVMTTSELRDCIFEDVIICPSRIINLSTKHCEAQLFFGSSDTAICEREILPLTDYFFEQVGNNWLYAVRESTNIFAQCFKNGVVTSVQHVELQNSGLIINGTSCTITGNNFHLPAATTGFITMNVSYPLVYWPDTTLQVLPEHNLTFLNDSIDPEILKSLDHFITSQQSRISANAVIQQILHLKQERKTKIIVLSTGISGSFLLLVLICVGFLLCRRKKSKNNNISVHQIPMDWFQMPK